MAVGDRAQTRALCEAGPRRLRCRAPPRRCAVWHPLDPRQPRAVDYGELLADGLLWLPAPTACAAPHADTGRAQPSISQTHLLSFHRPTDGHDGRDLVVSLAVSQNCRKISKRQAIPLHFLCRHLLLATNQPITILP